MRRSPTSVCSPRMRSTRSSRARRLCALAVCAALALACGAEDPAPDSAPAPVAAVRGDGLVDPTPYRAKLEATQALLWAEPELNEVTRKALSQALLDLHNEIVFNDSSLGARETSGRLFVLSARIEATPRALRGEREMRRLRELWTELCAEQFSPADWLDGH
jgi:hypothetical protein